MCIFQVINSIDSNGGYSTVLFGILIQGQNTSHNHFSKESTTLSKNTKKANTTPLHAFHCFVTFHSLSLTWLPLKNHLVHMWHIRQSSSDRSYIAGISNYSNIHNFHGTTRSFMLKKAMVGTSNLDRQLQAYYYWYFEELSSSLIIGLLLNLWSNFVKSHLYKSFLWLL